MKKVLLVLCSIVLSLILAGCGSSAGILDEEAAVRKYDPNDTTIYIVDEYVPLSDSTNSGELRNMAQLAMAIVNARRTASGLKELKWNIGLEQAACVRANEIESLFSHSRPDGSSYWTVNGNLVYGENLAKGYYSAEDVVAAWVASPTHNANLMDPGYTTCSIAIHESNGEYYWSQEFGY